MRTRQACVLALLTGLGLACAETATQQRPTARVGQSPWARPQTFDDTGLLTREYDIDGNGRVDVRRVMRVDGDLSTQVRAEWDLDQDGRIDCWVFYEGGQVRREEMDLDWDGRLDVVNLYENGRLSSREVATNFQGRPVVRKHFEQGQLVSVDNDTDGDGRFDLWEYYQGGRLVRLGRDTDGNGVEDYFTEPTERYRKVAEAQLAGAAKGSGPTEPPGEQASPAPGPAPPEPPLAPPGE